MKMFIGLVGAGLFAVGLLGSRSAHAVVVVPSAYSVGSANFVVFSNSVPDPTASIAGTGGDPAVLTAATNISGNTYQEEGGGWYRIHWGGAINTDDFPVGAVIDLHYDFTIALTANGAGGAVDWTASSTTYNAKTPTATGTTSDAVTHVTGDVQTTVNAPMTGGGWFAELGFTWSGESPTSRMAISVPSTAATMIAVSPAPEPASLLLLGTGLLVIANRRRGF